MKRTNPVLLSVAVLAGACGWGDTSFTLKFKDADGLKSGQPLLLQGVRVGEVQSVELSEAQARVEAHVYEKYSNAVCAESTFLIEKPGGFFDTTGERQINVIVRDAGCTAIRQGAVIRGRDTAIEAVAVAARDMALAGLARAKQLAESVTEEFSRSPTLANLSAAMRDFSAELGSPENAARLEALRKRADETWAELERLGRSAEARELRRRFEEWVREVQESLSSSDR